MPCLKIIYVHTKKNTLLACKILYKFTNLIILDSFIQNFEIIIFLGIFYIHFTVYVWDSWLSLSIMSTPNFEPKFSHWKCNLLYYYTQPFVNFF